MLARASIRNFGIIEHLDVDLCHGFSALTGESGSGKSMFLSAVKAAFADRVDKGKIRDDTDSANIVLEFLLRAEHPVWDILKDAGLEPAIEEPLIVSRVIPRKGASRARINGCAVAARDLSNVGKALIEVHEQHAFLRFFEQNYPRDLLDSFVDAKTLQAVRGAYDLAHKAAKALTDFDTNQLQGEARQRELAFCNEKLEELDPVEGEYLTLKKRRALLQNTEKIVNYTSDAKDFAQQCEIEDNFSKAVKQLNRLSQLDGLDENTSFKESVSNSITALERSLVEFQEFEYALGILEDACVFCPKDMDSVESRFQAFTGVARQIGREPENLTGYWEEIRAENAIFVDADAHRVALVAASEAALSVWRELAETLSKARQKTAITLTTKINKQLSDLRMEGVGIAFQFDTSGNASVASKAGIDDVAIMVHQGKSGVGRPLQKSASGGELSRITLALCIVDAQYKGDMTLIFDEIDQGVNGAIAASIGQKLCDLGSSNQVLAVTHSPQIAASAGAHIRICKSKGKSHKTAAATLDKNHRVEEIAALISGEKITPEAREAAKRLLEAA